MTTVDITALDYLQLNELKDRIAERMSEMRDSGVGQLRLKLITEAAALGLTAEDIIGTTKKQRRKRRRCKQDDTPVPIEDTTDTQ